MTSRLRRLTLLPLVLAACGLFTACDAVIDVQAAASVSAHHDRVLVTVTEVWLNESETAVPADATWRRFVLDDPRSIDLAGLSGGRLAGLAGDLVVPAGTYRQIRLILAASDAPLHDSAEDLEATWNNEVVWFDEDGDEETSPLYILNAEQGIGIAMELKVTEAVVGVSAGGSSSSSTAIVVFDPLRDLTAFDYGGERAFVLNPAMRAVDAGEAGTIRGTLDLSQIDVDTPTGRPDIQVTAQRLDEDADRHVIVASAALSANGAFVLYPLPLDDDERTTEYDLVIQGSQNRSVVLRDVPVTRGAPAAAAPLLLAGLVLQPAESFEADIVEGEPVVPRGARIGFHQTLPGEDEPHLMAEAGVDPVGGRLGERKLMSRASGITWATYTSGLTLREGVPEEGAARYAVAASSPHYGEGAFAAETLRPASPASDTALFSVPAIAVDPPAVEGNVSITLTVATPGQYDEGVLLISHEGAVVTVVALDAVLQQSVGSAFVDVQVPAGTTAAPLARAYYHVEAWTWRSADPQETFSRHVGAAAVDLRAGGAASTTLTVD